MKRQLYQEVIQWSRRPDRRPLLLRGARQTGKTYLIDEFGKSSFDHYLKVNFEKDTAFLGCFETLDPRKIIQMIELLSNQTITPGKSLLFLDEIQECPKAIQALRYFYEEMPELHVIGAGSLLEFALTAENFSMPVGRVSFLYLYPMSFTEMLLALNKNKLVEYIKNIGIKDTIPSPVHQELLKQLDLYFILGGMPQIVDLYAKHEKLLSCREAQSAILNGYRDDFGKYASQAQQHYCERVFNKSFELIGKHFKYTDIDPDMDYRGLKQAINLLFKANILTPIYFTNATGLPLSATQIEKKYKLLFLDLGLAQAAGRAPPEMIFNKDLMQINQGALTEQFVGQHLLTMQPNYDRAELFYWKQDSRGSQAEIDYLFAVNNKPIPLEVKAGKTGRLKSMHIYMQKHNVPLGIKLSTDALDTSGSIWSIPLYLVEELTRLIGIN